MHSPYLHTYPHFTLIMSLAQPNFMLLHKIVIIILPYNFNFLYLAGRDNATI